MKNLNYLFPSIVSFDNTPKIFLHILEEKAIYNIQLFKEINYNKVS